MSGDTLPPSECYDNFLHKACVVTPGNSMDSGLTGWAWVFILLCIAIAVLFVVCYLSARSRENKIMEQGGDPNIHIGGFSIRPSTAKLAVMIGVGSHILRNHKSITATPDWRKDADQYSNDLWKGKQ